MGIPETMFIKINENLQAMMAKLKIESGKTARGFNIHNFKDYYQKKCSIQESSLAEKEAIWVGVDNTGPDIEGPSGKVNEGVHAGRMHLTREQVAQLLPILKKFAETGKI